MHHLRGVVCALLACAAGSAAPAAADAAPASLAVPAAVAPLVRSAPVARAAGCGGVAVVGPTRDLGVHPAPLIVGDSVLLGAMPEVAARGYRVNAHGCRGWDEGQALLRRLKGVGQLPHLVAIALGANFAVGVEQIRRALVVLGPRRVLAVLTPREAGGWSGDDAEAVRAAGRRWPGRVVVLDWVRFSAGHGGWFQADGLHLMPPGARGLAELVARALPYARWGTAPRPRRRARPKAHAATVRLPVPPAPPAASPSSAATDPVPSAAVPLTAEALPAANRGAVGLRVAGAPGTAVTVSEDGVALATATLAAAPLVLRDVAAWRCRRRARTFVVADAAGRSVRVGVRTPRCRTRLGVAASRRLRAGGELRARVGNAWRTGPLLRATVCLALPAERERCTRRRLRAGVRARQLAWRAPRPGRALLTVRGAGRSDRRTIVVAPPGGRLRVLAAGDSEMQELDAMIRSGLGSRAVVHSDARISTGLTNTFFFDWVGHARGQAAALRPDVTVVFIGANDGFPLPVGGRQLPCCSRAWSRALAGRMGSMVHAYARGGAGVVYWFLLPLPRSPELRRYFGAINAGYRIAAAADPDDVKLVDATRTFTPHGYRDAMRIGDRWITVHQPDGYHLSYPAMQLAAHMVLAAMRRDRVI